MSVEKRKSSDANIEEEDSDGKKIKLTDTTENVDEKTESVNGSSFDDTPKYSMDSPSSDMDEVGGLKENDRTDEPQNTTDATAENGAIAVGSPKVEDKTDEPLNTTDATAENGTVVVGTLKPIESVQIDAKLVSEVVGSLDFDDIYQKILKHRKEKNRVEIVSNEIIDSIGKTDVENGNEADNVEVAIDDNIFKELTKILTVLPNADPKLVYDFLMSDGVEVGRVNRVLELVSNTNTNHSSSALEESSIVDGSLAQTVDQSLNRLNGPFSDPEFKNNPLYKDMKTLMKVLPDKDPNEVYAFLEAHFDKPNRVQIVIDELTPSDSQESLPLVRVESLEDTDRGKAPMSAEDKLMADLKQLRDIFRDCDPNFLQEKLNEDTSHNRVQAIAAELFESKKYPKLEDVLEEERRKDWKKKVTSLDFDIHIFLKKFPNPEEHFMDISNEVNDNYKQHVVVYIKNKYPSLKDGYIKKVLEEKKHHLAPSVQAIDEELTEIMDRPSKKKRDVPREEVLEYPEKLDEPFFQEVIFVNNRQAIIDHISSEVEFRKLKIETARSLGELLECACCCDDECLFEEMAACSDGHIFCKECVRRSCETAIGEGKVKFPCLSGSSCEQEFPLTVLQDLLSAGTFSLALRKMQEEELRLADITDLVSCPYCAFATIMPDPEDKVFKCLNQECLKESCRLCKEPNHVPLKCNEVEKQCATNMRTYIEMKITESMLRICQSCKKRFYKDSGCNKMTCTCGASMCYVCRAPNIDYNHFDDDTNQCKLYSNIDELHDTEMSDAAQKAKEEYLRDHPDQDPGEDFNIENMIEELKKSWQDGITYDDDYDEYEEPDDEENYDDDGDNGDNDE
ncbi:hypothetical protein ACF0H5_002590 [Mactra antiquata]